MTVLDSATGGKASMLHVTSRSLECRCVLPERMDDPLLDAQEHRRALRGLARLHTVTRTADRLWHQIRNGAKARSARELSLLDVGCGDGNLLRKLLRRARRDGVRLKLAGCDMSRRALAVCEEENGKDGVRMDLYSRDVLREPLPCEADVVMSSLFLHHFETAAAAVLLRKMTAATLRLMVVDDLHRSRLGYYTCWLGVHFLTRSAVVRTDGLRSVRAAFTVDEIRAVLQSIGAHTATVRQVWPQRLLLSWRPTGAG